MNYVVVVLEPVPQDLGVVAKSVSERFKISLDKAMALLQRAPGAVTKAVPEQQAKTVAEILSEAGLLVEVREGTAEGPPLPLFAAAAIGSAWSTASDADTAGTIDDSPGADGARRHDPFESQVPSVVEDEYRPLGAVTVGVDAAHDDDYVVGDRYEADVDAAASNARSVATTAGGSFREAPEAGHATATPPRDPMKTTLTREPPDLERGGLRRRIGTAATLPALLTLLVTLLALAVTLLPVLRDQQARRAEDSAIAVAATLQGLSGGLPLSAPIVRAAPSS
jgi:hypothetical protein